MSKPRCAICGGHCHGDRQHLTRRPPNTIIMEERQVALNLTISTGRYLSASIRASLAYRDRHGVDPPRVFLGRRGSDDQFNKWVNGYTAADLDIVDAALAYAAEQTVEEKAEFERAHQAALETARREQARAQEAQERANLCPWCNQPRQGHDDVRCAAERARAIEEHEAARGKPKRPREG